MTNEKTMMEIKQGQLETKLDNLEAKVNKIYDAFYGNGREGIIERNTRADASIEQMKCDIQEVRGMIESLSKLVTNLNTELSKSIGEVSKSIDSHHNDKSMHTPEGLFLRKNVLTVALLALIVIHSLLPTGINLWSIVSKFFGL